MTQSHPNISKIWLCQVYNRICQLKQIPKCFKHGVIIPAFKGKGRDPLIKKNYRGITLTSVIAKVFEIILTERISPILEDSGIPKLFKQHTEKEYHLKIQFLLV